MLDVARRSCRSSPADRLGRCRRGEQGERRERRRGRVQGDVPPGDGNPGTSHLSHESHRWRTASPSRVEGSNALRLRHQIVTRSRGREGLPRLTVSAGRCRCPRPSEPKVLFCDVVDCAPPFQGRSPRHPCHGPRRARHAAGVGRRGSRAGGEHRPGDLRDLRRQQRDCPLQPGLRRDPQPDRRAHQHGRHVGAVPLGRGTEHVEQGRPSQCLHPGGRHLPRGWGLQYPHDSRDHHPRCQQRQHEPQRHGRCRGPAQLADPALRTACGD